MCHVVVSSRTVYFAGVILFCVYVQINKGRYSNKIVILLDVILLDESDVILLDESVKTRTQQVTAKHHDARSLRKNSMQEEEKECTSCLLKSDAPCNKSPASCQRGKETNKATRFNRGEVVDPGWCTAKDAFGIKGSHFLLSLLPSFFVCPLCFPVSVCVCASVATRLGLGARTAAHSIGGRTAAKGPRAAVRFRVVAKSIRFGRIFSDELRRRN